MGGVIDIGINNVVVIVSVIGIIIDIVGGIGSINVVGIVGKVVGGIISIIDIIWDGILIKKVWSKREAVVS